MSSQLFSLLATIQDRIRPPLAIILGAPRLTADLIATLGLPEITCFQMDLHQAERLREELREIGADARVETRPDLWDLNPEFNTVLYAPPARGDRELKRDMIEQSYPILNAHGSLIVLSPVQKDDFFPAVMKKVYGKVGVQSGKLGTILTSPRGADRPGRRHEIRFQVRRRECDSLSFVSRPGVFTYGRMDDGARALAEVAEINAGDRIVDLGCGTGTVGVIAGKAAGAHGSVTFVDSNVRAVVLADINAGANGLAAYQVVADASLESLPNRHFDVALANPPYYAQHGIAGLFIRHSKRLLKPGGRLYVVTKHADVVELMLREHFGHPSVFARRGYVVFKALKRK